MPGLNTNNTHSACDVYRGGCSEPQGPYRRNIFSETLLLELTYAAAFLEQPERMEKSRKERINLLSLKMESLQVKLSRIHNLGLNFKNQRLASRSHSHPPTMCPGIFLNTL